MSELTVSRLAEQVGISADAVRYYERIGILPEPDRSPAGYRLYDDGAVGLLRFVKRAQRFGLRLEEIAELLDIRERGLCPCGHTRELLGRRVAALDEEMATLAELRTDIERMLEQPDGLLHRRPDDHERRNDDDDQEVRVRLRHRAHPRRRG
ncbi:MAG: MerR family DNA-binding protein [Acidimicrobiales bacterium]